MAATQTIYIMAKPREAHPNEFQRLPIQAQILVPGIFALHRPVEDITASGEIRTEARMWTLTHMPTGNAVLRHIPSIDKGKAIARELMNKGIDWTFTDISKLDMELRRRAKTVVDALKEVHELHP